MSYLNLLTVVFCAFFGIVSFSKNASAFGGGKHGDETVGGIILLSQGHSYGGGDKDGGGKDGGGDKYGGGKDGGKDGQGGGETGGGGAPEPATMFLLASGAAAAGLKYARRKKSASKLNN